MNTLKTLFAATALAGCATVVHAETWMTTGSGSGDPLTFTGSGGTKVEIDGFRTRYASGGSGDTYYSPYAIAWGSGVGVRRDSSDRHTIGNNASNYSWTDGILLSFQGKAANISEI